MKKLMVLGGLGFIGKNIIELLKNKYEIIVVSRSIDAQFCKENKTKYYQYNFGKSTGFTAILEQEKPDFIINLVSIVTAERNSDMFGDMMETNISVINEIYQSTMKWKPKLILNMGSMEEYGNIEAPFFENQREEPNSPYALTKQMATNTCIMYYKNYSCPFCVLRLSNVFGVYQNEKKIIPYIINNLLHDKEIVTTGSEQIRDFIYIKDLVFIIDKIISKPERFSGEIVNVASGRGIKLRELMLYCQQKIGKTGQLRFGAIPYRKNEPMNMVCSIEKLKSMISIEFKYTIYDAIDEYIDYVKRN